MQSIWYKCINAGLTNEHSYSERVRVILLNKITLIFLLLMSLRVLLDLIDQDLLGAAISLTIFGLFSLTFVFQIYGKTEMAAGYLLGFFNVMTTMLIVALGKNLGAEFCYFTAVAMVLMFYSDWKVVSTLLACTCIAYFTAQYIHSIYPPPLENLLTPISYHFVFFANLASILAMTQAFARENAAFKKQANSLLIDLKSKNSILLDKQSQIEVQNKSLEKVNKELERFAFIASHDLKSPLRNINSFLGLIKKRLTIEHKQDDSLIEYISYASASATKMHFLIQNILDYSRLNKKDVQFKEVDLSKIASLAQQNLKTFIEENKAQVIVNPLPKLKGLETQLTLLIQNLIENGIKYNTNETPRIEISYHEDDKNHIVSIKDNGIGIKPSYREKIFEMFTRLHGEQTYQGTGIGLAICKKIAENHNGKINVESVEGLGSIFSIRIPKSKVLLKAVKLEKLIMS